MSSRQAPVAGIPFPALVHETSTRDNPVAAPVMVQETITTAVVDTTKFFFGT